MKEVLIRKSMLVILIVLLLLLLPADALAQTDPSATIVPRLVRRGQTAMVQVESIEQPAVTPKELNNLQWKRVIYRELDLVNEKNAPLLYPLRPVNGKVNFFTLLVQLIGEDKINVYRYIDGYELFEEEQLLDRRDILKELGIVYETIRRDDSSAFFRFRNEDIPAGEMLTYYVKERWFIHPATSEMTVRIEAICPVWHQWFEEGIQRFPLFWVPYHLLEPYLSDQLIMVSDRNNVRNHTYEGFFRNRLYDGRVVKTENLHNKTLYELYPDPDSLRWAQENIENELTAFKKLLSWSPDSVKSVSRVKRTTRQEPAVKKETPPKEIKPAPVRSVRRR